MVDFVALTRLRARESGSATAFVFLKGGEDEGDRLTYGELDLRARAFAVWLHGLGGDPGDRVVLVYPPGLDFIVAFLGCLFAGRIAVPVMPPGRRQRDRRLPHLIEDCDARQVLICPSLRLAIEAQLSGMTEIPAVSEHPVFESPGELAEAWVDPGSPGEIAFLQYTSGSTDRPKGVMVSHRNLIDHCESIGRLDDGRPDRVMVSWLPMFHDMGLIWGVLYPLYERFPAYLMAPLSFLQQPYRWLAAISRFRGTHTAGPDSAYRLCARRVTDSQRATLDLGCWRYAINGAETVRASTLSSFRQTFADCGFRDTTLLPCYGLAESTLRVTQHLPGAPYRSVVEEPVAAALADAAPSEALDGGEEDAKPKRYRLEASQVSGGRVSCGTPPEGLLLRIVDPRTMRSLPAGCEGEIWTTSPWVTLGYWNRPEATEQAFRAFTAEGDGPFLRSGDLGVLIENELFVTGRMKEMLILRGTNYHPHDLEATLERAHPALAPSSAAVFAVEHGDEERLVAIFEIDRTARHGLDTEQVLDALSQTLALEWGLEALALVLLRPVGMPRTSSGKIQRLRCRDLFLADALPVLAERRRDVDAAHGAAPVVESKDGKQGPSLDVVAIRQGLSERLAEHLGVPVETFDPDQPFADHGLDSVALVGLSGELERWLGRRLSPTLLYDHPTVSRLAQHLAEGSGDGRPVVSVPSAPSPASSTGCAVLGMACRFPGADDPESFWRLLRDAEIAIRSGDRPELQNGHGPPVAGFLNHDVATFDPDFFGIAPREANSMDPQQRLLLEVAYEALENAGLLVQRLAGSKTGVFVGISGYDYALIRLAGGEGDAYSGTGSAASIAANRLSYTWDLRGPSLSVDTACSSSLAAVHLACRSLRSGDCDLAIVGAVNLLLAPQPTDILTRAGMLSPAGRCTPFDEAASGYVRGEGCGVLVLARDGEEREGFGWDRRPLAILRGTAMVQDGRSNGLTAPSGLAQRATVEGALADAGLEASAIDYVEAHGTGTPLGDPIELDALGAVFGDERDRPLWVSSVKANIGHLEAAAGVAGLIKTILAMEHGEIPPQAAFDNPSSRIDWQALPLAIPRQPTPWPERHGQPRRAGVSSFGFGGTNTHLVVEAPPAIESVAPQAEPEGRPLHLLTLSARDRPALTRLTRRYHELLLRDETDPRDLCASANRGRDVLTERLVVLGTSHGELLEGLERALEASASEEPQSIKLGGGVFRGSADPRNPGLGFLYSGQGGGLAAVGQTLYRDAQVFRNALDACDAVLAPELGCKLSELLWGEQRSRLEQTQFLQPALFALQVAYARLWASWGVEPVALLGHSAGEVAAAHLAGVFDLADASRLIAARGRLMQDLSVEGGMLAVFASQADLEPILGALNGDKDRGRADRDPDGRDGEVTIAAFNGPRQVVVAGPPWALDRLISKLRERSIRCRKLDTRHAFHSPSMAAAAEALALVVEDLDATPPTRTLISAHTGGVAGDEVTTGAYWQRQMLEPVRFDRSIETLRDRGLDTFVELGPGSDLLAMARRCPCEREGHWIPSARSGTDDWLVLLSGLARLHVGGLAGRPGVDWRTFEEAARNPVHLPNYPFARQRLWFTPSERPRGNGGPPHHPLLGESLPLATPSGAWVWFHDRVSPSFMADHRIEGSVVFGGTAFLEMALAASRAHGFEAPELIDFELEQALIYDVDEPQQLQTHLVPEEDEARLTIHGRGAGDQPWRPLVRATVRVVTPPCNGSEPSTDTAECDQAADDRLDLAAVQGRSREIPSEDFYATWATRGNQWGPRYQGVRRLWVGDGEALAQIEVPTSLVDELEASQPFLVHPALLDACVQVLAAVVPDSRPGAIVGQQVERFHLTRPHDGGALWSHARLRAEDDGRTVVGDLQVGDAEGRLLGWAVGVRLGLLQRAEADPVDPLRWLHAVSWAPAILADAPAPSAEAGDDENIGSWWVDGEGAVVDSLVKVLEQQGGRAVRSISELVSPLRGVIHVSADISLGNGSEPLDSVERLHRALRIAQSLASGSAAPLWLVTQGAWSVPATTAPTPEAAALWGFGRSLASEHPDLYGGLIDLDPADDPEGQATRLIELLLTPTDERQVLLRGDERWLPRLERLAAPEPSAVRLRADASYLVTGGLGGLGLLLADWLVSHGARRLVLMGRSVLPPRVTWNDLDPESREGRRTAAIRALEHRGANVVTPVVDVADPRALEDWLTTYGAEGWPSIQGVVHAAGEASATPVQSLDRQTLEATLGGKVRGAITLDRCLRDLDFFVLCSSASAILSSPGLAAYAAANASLDALAQARRARGHHALSFQWGAWSEVGLAAEGLREHSDDRGTQAAVSPIDPATGLELVERCWSAARDAVAVLPIDWNLWQAQYPTAARSPLFERVIAPTGDDDARVLREQLDVADPGERRERIGDWLRQRLATVLLTTPEAIEPSRPLNQLGLDSLMGLELRHQLDRQLGVSISMVELLRGASLSELVDQVAALLSEDGADIPELVAGPANEDVPLPLSHNQAAQLLLHELAPRSAAYHVAFAARIHSVVDPARLERSLRALVARHPSLRTEYSTADGQPRQTVRATPKIGFTVHDRRPPGSNGHGARGSSETGDLLAEIRRAYAHPFDLAKGPLLRADLFTLTAEHHILLLCAHHVACDGWSLWLLVAELGELYGADSEGRAPTLEAVPFRSTDFADWQQRLLAGPEGERLRSFWLERLSPPPPALDLPFDRPRPTTQTLEGASHEFWLDRSLKEAVDALARRHGATPYALLLAVFQIFLHRLTGQVDLTIGCPVTGRTRPGLEGVVGNFVNPVVVRTRVTPGLEFGRLLERTKGDLLDALAHQDYPFPLLVQDLRPAREASRSPLFQVDFLYQQPQTGAEILELLGPAPSKSEPSANGLDAARARAAIWGGLRVTPFELAQQEGQLDLTLEVVETPAGLYSVLKYARDLFEPTTIQRMAGYFETLVRGVVAEPDRPLHALPLLGTGELRQLDVWSRRSDAVPAACVHELVSKRAQEDPEAPAVICGDQGWSRGELEAASNRLAHHLLSFGLSREARVGIYLERSLDLLATLLAVSKIGATWVPLDPAYPAQRLIQIARHADLDLLVTDPALADSSPIEGVPCCLLEPGRESLAALPRTPPDVVSEPRTLAYVIYTSGSTGVPKGVAIEQQAWVNLLESMRREPGFSADDRLLAITTLAFDIAALELLLPLITGGLLVVAERADSFDPGRLVGLIEQHRINVLQATPATWQLLLAAGADRLPALRVLSGGEALHRELAAQLATVGEEVWNVYGPTETTIWSGVHRVGGEPPELATIPIGKPILGTSFRILDAMLGPVPIGVAGDLYIGGVGLARGYWRGPAITAEHFVPDPWSQEPGARLYRTGDRALWTRAGDVVFLGRRDQQVKIRGFRIEPGEIEAVLCRQPEVVEAAVVVRQDRRGDPRLVAFVVALGGSNGSETVPDANGRWIASLRAVLREQLPEYMIPTCCEPLTSLPRTDNGKIDRRALPTPAALLGEATRSADYVPPSGSIERTVAETWGEVLELESVGRHDNFFDLGGHSLLLVETHRRLRQKLQEELEVIHLLEYPTVAGLAAFLRRAGDTTHDLAATETRADQQRAALALAQQRARQRRRHGLERG